MTVTLSLIVLVAGLSTGVRVRADARASAPRARHFPGLPAKPPARPGVRPLTWFVAAAVSVAVVGGFAIWNASAAATLVLALGAAAVLAAIAWPFHTYARACERTNRAILDHAPVIAMPYAGKMLVHVGMWAPHIDKAGLPWCVVAHTPELLDRLAEAYEVPMLAGSIPESVKVALYPHGAARNKAFLASRSVTHVFLGHGDSDKPLSASSRVLDYDLIAVAGQAAIDRFAAAGLDVPADRLRIIGRPQTAGIRPAAGPMSSIDTPTVLYAPTWRHADDSANLSSLIVGETIVKALLARGATVLFRRHFAGRNHAAAEAMIERIYTLLEADAAATGHPHVWGEAAASELPLVEVFNRSDAMICDVSGIVVDFMQSEKPFAMYASQVPTGPDLSTVFRAANPSAESAYVIDRDAINVDTILSLMLGPDPLSPSRHDRAAYYLGGPDRDDPERPFVELLLELTGSSHTAAAASNAASPPA